MAPGSRPSPEDRERSRADTAGPPRSNRGKGRPPTLLVATTAALAGLAVWLGITMQAAHSPAPDRSPLPADRSPLPPDRSPPPEDFLPPAAAEPNVPQPVPPLPPRPAPDDRAPGGPAGLPVDSGLRGLLLPVEGVDRDRLLDDFDDRRGGDRRHEAIDILAPRHTPVLAVADGTVAKLFESVPGGHTIYQFDRDQRYCYYYAHLESYARGLQEGDPITRGQVIGYVGTSGNAPPDVPHLHFAIYRLGPDRRWWEGEPLNPFPALRQAE